MFKTIGFILIIFFFNASTVLSDSDVYISLTVNKEIITNQDIENEIGYLQLLNPGLNQLSKKNQIEVGKNSLINEMIKKEEIKKKINLEEENVFVSEYLKNLFQKLNVDNEDDFEKILNQKKTYSLSEIKQKLKIEILWNEFIYSKYINQVKINKNTLLKKIDSLSKDLRKEYFLSEIIFEKKINDDLNSLINKINSSILEIGFNNTANIYSISETSKYGGEVGWVDENNLSSLISKNLNKINVGEHTGVIKINNNFIILKIEEVRSKEVSIDKDEELKKMINFETNNQLNQFSKIFFNKSKMNYIINEK